MLAAKRNRIKIIEKLFKEGADINLSDYKNRTPLIHAVIKNQTEAVLTLIEMGADVEIMDNNNKTALMIAKERNGGANNDILSAFI